MAILILTTYIIISIIVFIYYTENEITNSRQTHLRVYGEGLFYGIFWPAIVAYIGFVAVYYLFTKD